MSGVSSSKEEEANAAGQEGLRAKIDNEIRE